MLNKHPNCCLFSSAYIFFQGTTMNLSIWMHFTHGLPESLGGYEGWLLTAYQQVFPGLTQIVRGKLPGTFRNNLYIFLENQSLGDGENKARVAGWAKLGHLKKFRRKNPKLTFAV